MVNFSPITQGLSPDEYSRQIAKPLRELLDKERLFISSQSWNIRDAHQQDKTFESRAQIDFPPIDGFAVTDLLFDPKKGLKLVARDNNSIIAEETALPISSLFGDDTDLAFKKSWVVEEAPMEGQEKGLIKRLFREPDEVFRYLAAKVFNKLNQRIIDFAELAADGF